MKLINKTLIGIQIWFNNLMSKEDGAEGIVTAVVLIGVAVLLAIIFKDQITALLNSLFDTITNKATTTVGG